MYIYIYIYREREVHSRAYAIPPTLLPKCCLSWICLAAFFGPLGPFLRPLGILLGLSWGLTETLGNPRDSVGGFERSWGAFWGRLRPLLGP